MSEHCPTCGAPVHVVSGGEGTRHYEPIVLTSPRDVDCPTCLMGAGEACVNATTGGPFRVKGVFHKARTHRWREQT